MNDFHDPATASAVAQMKSVLASNGPVVPQQAAPAEPLWSDPAPVTSRDPQPEVKTDPKRPEAVRGRYKMPDPVTGKARSWQRVSNFIKLAENTYHLELWKQRNVAKGLAMRPDLVEALHGLDVKADRDRMNNICEQAQVVAGAYKMSDEGTALHKSTELADYAGGDVSAAPTHHQAKVQLYLDALRVYGLTVVDDMIERVTLSTRYSVVGTFDRVYRLRDGSYVIGDVKTGDDLELSFPSISGQLGCYEDGINTVGIWDGRRYDTSIKVRTDFGIVVHLPSTRDEVEVHRIKLDQGHELLSTCLRVREQQRVKAHHVAEPFDPSLYGPGVDTDAEWLELMNAAHTVPELIRIADRARVFGQWNERLAGQARLLAKELT